MAQYKVAELIEKGLLDINVLPEETKSDIDLIKSLSADFTVENDTAHTMDDLVYGLLDIKLDEPVPASPIIPVAEELEEKPIEKEIQQEIIEEVNPFIGDNFFKKNPTKVLGTQVDTHTQAGIIVKGDAENIKIDVPVITKVFNAFDRSVTSIPRENLIQETLSSYGKAKIFERPKHETTEQYFTTREVVKMYNPDISDEELQAFLYCNPALPFEKYIEKFTFEKEELVKKGLICYNDGEWQYKYTYITGNLHEKMTYLKRDKDMIIKEYGEFVFNNQEELLNKSMPRRKKISSQDPNELIYLTPYSDFSIRKTVRRLLSFDNDFVPEKSIRDAFIDWLETKVTTSMLTYHRNVSDIVKYYVRQQSYPIPDKQKLSAEKLQEEITKKIETIDACQKDGELLFSKFLTTQLIDEDRVKIEVFWNEEYNALALPILNKIPVCFSISKNFKTSNNFQLKPYQRDSVAFENHIGCGLLALDVGLGKTASAIASISQAVENKKAKYPLVVSPLSVVYKWCADIEGACNENGHYLHGMLPHFPKVRFLHNMNKENIRKVKVYSAEEQEQIDSLIPIVAWTKQLFTDDAGIPEQIFDDTKNPRFSGYAKDLKIGLDKETERKIGKAVKAHEGRVKKNRGHDFYEKSELQLDNDIKKIKEDYIPTYRRQYLELVNGEEDYLVCKLGYFPPVEEGTITVVTEQALQSNRIGVSDYMPVIERAFKILTMGENVEEINKNEHKLYNRLKSKLSSHSGNAKVFLEDMGIDYIVIDEAHHFKSIFESFQSDIKGKETDDESGKTTVKRENHQYELKGRQSEMGLSAFLLCSSIQINNDNKNVLLLTATPFENNPIEIYAILSLCNYQSLKDNGFGSMKKFFDTFLKIEYDMKISAQNKVIKAQVLNGYVNLHQFRTIIRNIIFHLLGQQTKDLTRPDLVLLPNEELGIETKLFLSEKQTEMMNGLEAYIDDFISYNQFADRATFEYVQAQKIRENELIEQQLNEDLSEEDKLQVQEELELLKTNEIKENLVNESGRKDIRVLKSLVQMRQLTVSPFETKAFKDKNIYPTPKEFIESSPKLNYVTECIKSVKEYCEKNNLPIAGQIIYMNTATGHFDLIKQYLTDTKVVYTGGKRKTKTYVKLPKSESYGIGFDVSEVGIITGSMNDKQKEQAKKDFLDNKLKVLIGSKSIQVGVDLQNHGAIMYVCHFDWNPTDNNQVIGRIWRQGNKYEKVRVVYPLCIDSADVITFQYLKEKTNRLKDVWDLEGVKSQLDLKDFNPIELQIALIQNPNKKATARTEVEKKKLENRKIYLENQYNDLSSKISSLEDFRDLLPKAIQKMIDFNEAYLHFEKNVLIDEQDKKISPLQDELAAMEQPLVLLNKERESLITGLTDEISDIEKQFSEFKTSQEVEKVRVKNELGHYLSDTEDTDEVQNEKKVAFKKQISDIDALIIKTEQDNSNKIDKLKVENEKELKKLDKKIELTNKEIGEKIEKLNSKINGLNGFYTKKIQQLEEKYAERLNKISNESAHGNKKRYYAYLMLQSNNILIWNSSNDGSWLSIEMEDFYDEYGRIKSLMNNFRNAKYAHDDIVYWFLEPMGLSESEADNAIQKYLDEIDEVDSKLGNIDTVRQELLLQYQVEYEKNRLEAKTPAQLAEDFSKYNFYLSEIKDTSRPENIDYTRCEVQDDGSVKILENIEQKLDEIDQKEEQEIEEIAEGIKEPVAEKVEKIKVESIKEPAIDVEKQKKYITIKLKAFNNALKAAEGKDKIYIKVKIKAFKAELTRLSEMKVEGGKIEEIDSDIRVWQSAKEETYQWWINDIGENGNHLQGICTIAKKSSNYDVAPITDIELEVVIKHADDNKLFEKNKEFIKNSIIAELGRMNVYSVGEKFVHGGSISYKKGDLVFAKDMGNRGLVGMIVSDIYKDTEDNRDVYDVYFRGYNGEVIPLPVSDFESILNGHLSFAENNGDLMHYPNIAKKLGITLNPIYQEMLDDENNFSNGGNIDEEGNRYSAYYEIYIDEQNFEEAKDYYFKWMKDNNQKPEIKKDIKLSDIGSSELDHVLYHAEIAGYKLPKKDIDEVENIMYEVTDKQGETVFDGNWSDLKDFVTNLSDKQKKEIVIERTIQYINGDTSAVDISIDEVLSGTEEFKKGGGIRRAEKSKLKGKETDNWYEVYFYFPTDERSKLPNMTNIRAANIDIAEEKTKLLFGKDIEIYKVWGEREQKEFGNFKEYYADIFEPVLVESK